MIQLISRSSKITPKSKQRVYYRSFARNFALNPVTGNIVIETNEQVVQTSMENLVMTNKGERFYQNDVGGDVERLLFEPVDDVTSSSLQESITRTITQQDNRASALSVSVIPNPDEHYYDITIAYTDMNNQPRRWNFPLVSRVR